MNKSKALLFTMALAGAAVLQGRDASACGGCFAPETETTVVTGHRMILSVSQAQTTLYDQIVYSGEPSSFAWVLPIKGLATIGLSSDALFQELDNDTQIFVQSPPLNCPPPPGCFGGGVSDGSGGAGGGGPVTVVAQQTVGPYETVQLMATDAHALTDWLAAHGYNLPVDVQPVIDAYVTEQFNFLALKLVPGQGIKAMRPVRVTTPGATPTLPLRMVAAGTGAITPITLWMLGEGRYEPTNLPKFTVDQSKLVWNWDTQSSNYSQLKQDGFTASANKGWLIQAAEPFSRYQVESDLMYLVQSDPVSSGYGDASGNGAEQAFTDDILALFGNIPASQVWITRLTGELSRAALGDDLHLGASADQSQLPRFLTAQGETGTPPPCPTFPPCDTGEGGFGGGNDTGAAGSGWDFWGNGSGGSSKLSAGGGGCTMTGVESVPMLSGLALMAGLALARRRSRERK